MFIQLAIWIAVKNLNNKPSQRRNALEVRSSFLRDVRTVIEIGMCESISAATHPCRGYGVSSSSFLCAVVYGLSTIDHSREVQVQRAVRNVCTPRVAIRSNLRSYGDSDRMSTYIASNFVQLFSICDRSKYLPS